MTGDLLAKRPCPQCGYIEPCNDDLPPIVLTRPWHVRNRQAVKSYVASLAFETHEWLLALFVDKHLNLLAVETIGRGDVSGANVNFAAILCRGQALKASGFILVHNHPSGDARPSATDIRTTNRLRHVSRELDLPLLEHFIIAGDELTTVGGL